ncbi:hypothetical protein BFR04_01355 [Gaetbulibacter sp. 4G1]|nr:hypothetical protein [Gaetbulibacter sp. 4G1]PIA79519.1 hypothetical protein BFR04_01355 [Gaetbulibacter sp. 4G1]
MKICNLSFGKIVILSKNLAEVIVDDGVLIDEVKVAEYHDFLLNSLESPFSLLINKKNAYSYTFSAQKNIASLKQIKAMAVVAHTTGGVMSTETLINVNGNYKLNIRVFYKREEAVTWLGSLE